MWINNSKKELFIDKNYSLMFATYCIWISYIIKLSDTCLKTALGTILKKLQLLNMMEATVSTMKPAKMPPNLTKPSKPSMPLKNASRHVNTTDLKVCIYKNIFFKENIICFLEICISISNYHFRTHQRTKWYWRSWPRN